MHEAHEINIGGVRPRGDYFSGFSKFEFLDKLILLLIINELFKGIK